MTHVTEVVTGEGPLAETAIQTVQVSAVQLDQRSAVQAELVHRRGKVSPLMLLYKAGLRQAWDFLTYGGAIEVWERRGPM